MVTPFVVVLLCLGVHGGKLTIRGDVKNKCKSKNFKGRLIETCTVPVPPQLQHIVTETFPAKITSKMTSTHTLLAEVGMHIRMIFEVIDIDCKSGYLMITEGKKRSQKLCTTGVQYPNLVTSGSNKNDPVKIIVSVDNPKTEFRVKIGFVKLSEGCGKAVADFPRSIDPCIAPKPVMGAIPSAPAMTTPMMRAPGAVAQAAGARPMPKHYLQQFSWRRRQQAKINKPPPMPVGDPAGPRADLPPSFFEQESFGVQLKSAVTNPDGSMPLGNVQAAQAVQPSVAPTEPTTTEEQTTLEPTLGSIVDPELIQFQKDLDRRYFNLNKKPVEKKETSGGVKALMVLIVIVLIGLIIFGARYYHLRFSRLKQTAIMLESGEVTLTLQRNKKSPELEQKR